MTRMMRMEHRQTQTQTQQLVLTQKMQQALHILQLSGMELETFLQQELETNPFLEPAPKAVDTPEAMPTPLAEPSHEDVVEQPFDLDAYAERWDIRHREGRDLSRNDDLNAHRAYYESSITQEQSLRAHLLTQMRMAAANETDYAIGERIIIGDIDERGFFTGNTEEIAQELEVTPEQVEVVLATIQRFEPTGIGARNLTECLLLQIAAEYPGETDLEILVRTHLDDLIHRQIPVIAKKMKISPERVEELKGLLSTLNPWPGHEFNTAPPQYITPDVVVEKVDDEYVVSLTEDRIPGLRIDKEYQEQVRRMAQSAQDREYIRGKIESANWLQRNIAQRQRTILLVAQAIVDVQRDFMEKGVSHIKPLTLQNIADVVHMHESTIARTTRGKYMQTPQGLFELKYFFSPGLMTDGGDTQSSKSVQALIKKVIGGEDPRKPLSDQQVADIITKDHGIHIARRTVTKYREAMGILKTSMRRAY